MSNEKSILQTASTKAALYDYAAAINMIEPLLGEEDVDIRRSAQELLANALYVTGQTAQAVEAYDALLTIAVEQFPTDERSILTYRHGRALCLRASGEEKAAATELDGVLAARSALLGASDRGTLNTRHHRMVSMRIAGENEAAEEEGLALIKEQIRVLGKHHEDVYAASIETGRAMIGSAKFPAAERWFAELYASTIEHLGDHPYRWSAGREWARTLAAVGEHDRAIEQARAALAGAERLLGSEHPSVRSHTEHLATLLSAGK